jgi:D-arabinan exo alpha-(1,3)/(1,5)-arabinofuranosidase (non-reducing end)
MSQRRKSAGHSQAATESLVFDTDLAAARGVLFLLLFFLWPCVTKGQSCFTSGDALWGLTEPHDYVQKRASSYDRTGANADYRTLAAGETLTLLDDAGPGVLTHIWFTIASDEHLHLKKLVLRMYWDNEPAPSVEAPVGDFFGLGLGEHFLYQSRPLAVSAEKALNSFFVMPFQRKARITVSNEGQRKVEAFYFNIDYRACSKPLPADTLYFHAQYRQAAPAKGWTNDWSSNGDPKVENQTNLNGEGNYVWMEAQGRGQFAGVTMSVLQNQDGWWGEGDDMFFVDGETRPSINGTGSEDYFLGAWDFGSHSFFYPLFGAPVKGEERAGGRWSLYRFHLDSPITFTKSLKATIEHGHANHRSDNYYSVAYWYQTEPHAAFPALPAVIERLPRIYAVGGPGNAAASKSQ